MACVGEAFRVDEAFLSVGEEPISGQVKDDLRQGSSEALGAAQGRKEGQGLTQALMACASALEVLRVSPAKSG